jgi:hypothetical protein
MVTARTFAIELDEQSGCDHGLGGPLRGQQAVLVRMTLIL